MMSYASEASQCPVKHASANETRKRPMKRAGEMSMTGLFALNCTGNPDTCYPGYLLSQFSATYGCKWYATAFNLFPFSSVAVTARFRQINRPVNGKFFHLLFPA